MTGYLTILKVRYRDILNYVIDIPEELYPQEVLKLLLQPLVENALYHGIKTAGERERSAFPCGRKTNGFISA